MKNISDQFSGDVTDIIDKYRDQGISICEAVGVLELIKYDLMQECLKGDEL